MSVILSVIKEMPYSGLIIMGIIGFLLLISLILLFAVYSRYKHITDQIRGSSNRKSKYLRYVAERYTDLYKLYGRETNTEAVVDDAINSVLSGSLFCERFVNNAVSLFVTLGLFGTFLGLSLSVGSLTTLITENSANEWLSLLDSIGEGLLSALSGMGIAFYTSLAGVGCSIILSIIRSIFSPAAARAAMASKTVVWLNQMIAPTLQEPINRKENRIIQEIVEGIRKGTDNEDEF